MQGPHILYVNNSVYPYKALKYFCIHHGDQSFFFKFEMNGIMHKWANPHFEDFEKKKRFNM